jgi:ribosomal protein L13
MDLQGGKTTLLWVPEHVSITGNEKQIERIEWKHQEEQQEKWNNTKREMKKRKPNIRSNRNIQTMTTKDEVVISRLITAYYRATQATIMSREPRPECSLCGVPLTINHIL